MNIKALKLKAVTLKGLKNKRVMSVTLLSVFTLALAAPTFAANRVNYEYGKVIDAVPIVKHVKIRTPREECWDEQVTYRERARGNGISTVIGAIVGGAIGNAVGHRKHNQQVGTVVGAVLGGTIGRSIETNRRTGRIYSETEEVCKVYTDYSEEERIVGYNVRYRYNNDTYSIRTDTDPGETIKLRVSVTPVI